MVIPFTSSVAREVLKAVPLAQREAAYALGATRWEAIRAALFYARTGIVGAVMLGFGRALGETMAVTMVIGNNPQMSLSLFAPQYTMAAVIANEFTEAADDLYLDALVEIGLVLFVITLIINCCSRLLIWSMTRSATSQAPRRRAPRRKRPHERTTPCRRLLSAVFVALLRAVGAAGAGAARVRSCFSSSARASGRSTSTSSRTCRSRSANRAAAWPTRSSAR